MRGLIAYLVGLLFALGLGLSGMTQPHIVRGFLNIFGEWDWRLLGVMIGAIGVHVITYPLIMKKKSPLLDAKFYVPSNRIVDKRLIMGSIIFGLGWGWAGICPGPGIVALASYEMQFVYFILSMLLGMKLFQVVDKKTRG